MRATQNLVRVGMMHLLLYKAAKSMSSKVKFIGNTASEGHTTYVIKARTEETKKCILVGATIFLPVILVIGDKFRWSKLEHPKAELLDLKHWKSLLVRG